MVVGQLPPVLGGQRCELHRVFAFRCRAPEAHCCGALWPPASARFGAIFFCGVPCGAIKNSVFPGKHITGMHLNLLSRPSIHNTQCSWAQIDGTIPTWWFSHPIYPHKRRMARRERWRERERERKREEQDHVPFACTLVQVS